MTTPAFGIRVDPDTCQGRNRCYAITAKLYAIDDWGQSAATGIGVVPADLMTRARRAVANCPECAISLTEVEQ